MSHLNAAFYCFTPLEDRSSLKREWLARLGALGVKGTIILAPEGLNGFLAGAPESLREALAYLRGIPSLASLHAKESVSDFIPFKKLCIKLKREIVTFRQGSLEKHAPQAPRLAPEELRRWYEIGRAHV